MSLFVFGNYTEDLTFHIPRMPEEGETLLSTSRTVDFGGKGANQAVMAARCGVKPKFAVALGRDAAGRRASARLIAEGIDSRHFIEVSGPTDQSVILLTHEGANSIVSSCDASHQLTPALCDQALDDIESGDLVLLQGNLSYETTEYCLARAKHQGGCTVINPAPVNFAFDALWPHSDVVLVNEPEACMLSDCADAREGARRLRALGIQTIIVTLGAEGALLCKGAEEIALPAPRVRALDTTGAGDAFCGVLVAGMALGIGLETTLSYAVRAASMAVTRQGALSAYPTREEMALIFAS